MAVAVLLKTKISNQNVIIISLIKKFSDQFCYEASLVKKEAQESVRIQLRNSNSPFKSN